MELSYVLPRIIFETVVGSRAYGTNHAESDYDKSGIMIPGKEYFYSWREFEEFGGFPEKDRKVYNIKKALGLIKDCNPNMMDLLWTPERCWVVMTPYWENIMAHRDLFVCKRVRYTFSGYAIAQLNRIKVHRKYLLSPPLKAPTRADFGLPEFSMFPTSQLKAVVYAALEFIANEEKSNFFNELDGIYGDYVIPLLARFLNEEERSTALEWLQMGIKSQAKAFLSLGTQYLKDEYIDVARKEVLFYDASKEWAQYQSWKKNRNKARSVLEEKSGYDCYSADTEFLTETGWKLFKDIATEKLATVFCGSYRHRKTFSIEYQDYLDKFEGSYTGDMYNLYGNHLDVLVTPNHRILHRKKERKSGKRYDFALEEISRIPDTFEILVAPTPIKKRYKNEELKKLPIKDTQYMRLMGWYLSDGYMNMLGEDPKCIRISQKEHGKLYWSMLRFKNEVNEKVSCQVYRYKRKPNAFNPNEITEVTMTVSDKNLRNRMLKECGRLKEKRIPRYVFGLSKRLKEALLDALVGGDGTFRKTSFKSIIYYSSLKNLADDIQELALSCGWETSLYGPYLETNKGYDCYMYQVHVNKNKSQFKTCMRHSNIKKIPVSNQKIVCFTVPNGTLITRRNGHVAIQGNSKHAMHLVRLLRMGKEILQTGEVHVDRTGIDAEELISIRNGSWTYDQIEEYAKTMDAELGTLYETSKLKKHTDDAKIQELCVETVDKFLTEEKFNKQT